jgi:hypothetical protein
MPRRGRTKVRHDAGFAALHVSASVSSRKMHFSRFSVASRITDKIAARGRRQERTASSMLEEAAGHGDASA